MAGVRPRITRSMVGQGVTGVKAYLLLHNRTITNSTRGNTGIIIARNSMPTEVTIKGWGQSGKGHPGVSETTPKMDPRGTSSSVVHI